MYPQTLITIVALLAATAAALPIPAFPNDAGAPIESRATGTQANQLKDGINKHITIQNKEKTSVGQLQSALKNNDSKGFKTALTGLKTNLADGKGQRVANTKLATSTGQTGSAKALNQVSLMSSSAGVEHVNCIG